MNRKRIITTVTVCVALVLMISSVEAQILTLSDLEVSNARIGTAAASELLIPVGARGMAMSGAVMATTSGINSLHWNPGGLALLTGSAQGMFSSMSYIADINVNYGAVGINFGDFGTIAVSIKSLSFGDIMLTTVDDPEGIAGRTYSPTYFTFGLSYGRKFTDAITVGGTLKMISEKMHRVTGSGIAIDIGIQYRGVAGISGVNLGVALKNVGPQVKFDGPGLLRQALASDANRPVQYYASTASSWELPTSIEIGLAYEYNVTEELGFNLGSSYTNNSMALDSYKIGGEVKYGLGNLSFAGRGGIDLWDKKADDEAIFGPTFGFGLLFKNPNVDVGIDYAYRTVDFFNTNHMFAVTLGF